MFYNIDFTPKGLNISPYMVTRNKCLVTNTMKKEIQKRGINGTGCIVFGVNELKEHLDAEIGDKIDIQRYKIIKKKKEDE